MLVEIAYDWNRSWSSGTLSMRLIWSYREKVLLLAPASQSNQIQSSTNKHTERTAAATCISSAQQESAVYLREGRRLSRAPPETGSLRSDFTSCGSAPSAFCPRAAPAIASLRFAGRWVPRWPLVLEGSGDFASKTL